MATEWAAAAMKLVLWGALMAPDIEMPPAKFDRPYPNIQYVWDFPIHNGGGEYLWGYTEPPRKRGGLCRVHLSPVGSVVLNMVMTEEGLQTLIRHETAHCNGWKHEGSPQARR